METRNEIEVVLPGVRIQISTVDWQSVEDAPPYDGYCLSQRLSENHAPLRIGKLSAHEVLPRVRSVGLLPPGHSVRLFPIGKPLRVLLCIFDEDHFQRVTGTTREQWDEHVDLLVAIKNKRLEILMQEIHAELLQPDFGSETLLESVSNMILVELARHARKLNRQGGKSVNSVALAPWQYRRIQERIQASQQEGYPSLAELAELCGISQGHLARTFKLATGWQIHKYIAEERLRTAKQMLADGALTCEEVSARLGFKSPAYFSTAFRRMTGKSPSEYRSDTQVKPISV